MSIEWLNSPTVISHDQRPTIFLVSEFIAWI